MSVNFDPTGTGILYIPESGGAARPIRKGQVVDADALIIPGVGLIKIVGGGTISIWGINRGANSRLISILATGGWSRICSFQQEAATHLA